VKEKNMESFPKLSKKEGQLKLAETPKHSGFGCRTLSGEKLEDVDLITFK
jgi:hypothetical protein